MHVLPFDCVGKLCWEVWGWLLAGFEGLQVAFTWNLWSHWADQKLRRHFCDRLIHLQYLCYHAAHVHTHTHVDEAAGRNDVYCNSNVRFSYLFSTNHYLNYVSFLSQYNNIITHDSALWYEHWPKKNTKKLTQKFGFAFYARHDDGAVCIACCWTGFIACY